MHKIKVSHESPISLLEKSEFYNDYQYGLCHLFKDPAYYEYFRSYKDGGGYVLLDNSLFELEKPFSLSEFAKIVKDFQPDEYIIPDSLDNTQETITNVILWKKYLDIPGKAIGVVQGSTWKELEDCFKFLSEEPTIKKIAISFNSIPFGSKQNENYAIDCGINRYAFLLKQWADGRMKKPLHLLGCSLPQEFKYYLDCPFRDYIDSVDTSNPVLHGMMGLKYDAVRGLINKVSTKMNDLMHEDVDETQLETIYYNALAFRRYLNGNY